MSINVPDHFVSEFSSNVELLLQEQGSKLRPFVREGTHTGKQASPVSQVGSIVASSPSGRFAPKDRTDANLPRRWVLPQDKDVDQLLDQFDMQRLIEDLKGPYAENAAKAIGRAMDDAVIDAALGTSTTGEIAGSTEAFDTGAANVAVDFGAAGDVGLTVAKMIEARRIMRASFVDIDNEPMTMIISSVQEANLLNQVEVVSSDFNGAKPTLVDGMITRFLGFNIVVSERLDLVSGDTACIAFVQSGMHLGIWKDIRTTVSIRNDLSSEPWDIYTCATFGATRLEQQKVIRVLCNI